MARYVIDAPTFVHLAAGDLVAHPTHRLVAPSRLRSEALELLLRSVRAGDRTEAEALRLHEWMTATKVRLLGDRVSRRTAWELAVAHGWPDLRDAEHLAVARLQADALVTVDADLAARAAGIVPVAEVAALRTVR